MDVYGSNLNSLAIGNHSAAAVFGTVIGFNSSINFNGSSTIIGANSYAQYGLSIVIGFNSGAKGTSSVIIGANIINAIISSQIVIGSASQTVYFPGIPVSGTTTPYTSLVVSSGIQLQTAYSSNPTINQLGYKLSPISSSSPIPISSSGAVYSLQSISIPKGIWIISFSVSLAITGTVTMTSSNLAMSTSSSSFAVIDTASGQIIKTSTETYDGSVNPLWSCCFVYSNGSPYTSSIYQLFQATFSGGTVSATGYCYYTRIG